MNEPNAVCLMRGSEQQIKALRWNFEKYRSNQPHFSARQCLYRSLELVL